MKKTGNLLFLIYYFLIIPILISVLILMTFQHSVIIIIVLFIALCIVSLVVAVLDPAMRRQIFVTMIFGLMVIFLRLSLLNVGRIFSRIPKGELQRHPPLAMTTHSLPPVYLWLVILVVVLIAMIIIRRKIRTKVYASPKKPTSEGIQVERFALPKLINRNAKKSSHIPIRQLFVQVSKLYLAKKEGIALAETAEQIKMRLLSSIDQDDHTKLQSIIELVDAYQNDRYGKDDILSKEDIERLKQSLLS
jgi:hypothetical protein